MTSGSPVTVDTAAWEASPFRALLGAVSDPAFVYALGPDGPGPYLAVNDTAVERYGYSREELLRMRPADLIESGGVLGAEAFAALRKEGGTRAMAVHRAKDGRRVHVVASARLVEHAGREVVAVVAREVPARGGGPRAAGAHDEAELALHAREESFRLLVEGVRDYAIFMLDPGGHIRSWNAGAERIKGWRADEILGKHFSTFYPPESLATGLPARELRTAAAEGRVEDEGWRVRKDGSRFWANVVITALYDASGTLRGYGKVTRDLTERRRAEEEVRASEERFRALFNDTAVGVAVTSPEGRLAEANATFARLLGRRRTEAVGLALDTFVHPDDLPTVRTLLAEVLAGTRATYQIEHRVLRKDGEVRWLGVSAAPLRDAAGRPEAVIKTVQDITERRRLEEAAVEAAEAERRRLSYELHDDLAQRLAGASVLAHTLAEQLQASGYDGAQTAARLGELVRGAMAHARALSRALAPVDLLDEGLDEALGRLCAATEEAYGLRCRFHSAGAVTLRDPAVATHLFRVAQEAVSNAARHAGASEIEVSLTREGEHVRLAVRDDGHGIPLGQLPETTAGHGLRTMRSRAAALGGVLTIERGAAGGTLVVCTVPRRAGGTPSPRPGPG